MSPLDLLRGAVVERVARRAGSGYPPSPLNPGAPVVPGKVPMVVLQITVRLPDGAGRVSFDSSSRTGWRRVAKKAGVRLTSKAAREAAESLRARVEAAVSAERARPDSALLNSKVMERVASRRRKSDEMAAKLDREVKMRMMCQLMRETKASEEEVLEAWRTSVVADVMGS